MRAEPRGIFRLARKPIAGQLRRLLDSDLERLKTLVETTPQSEDGKHPPVDLRP